MPHRCTKCGSVFSDGDSVILTGCPECKWNKFLYVKNEEMNSSGELEQDNDLIEHEIEILMKKQDENTQAMNDVLENIDKALDSADVNKKDLNPDRVDSIRILDAGSYELNLGSILQKEEIVVGIKEEGQYAIDLPMMLQKSNKTSKNKKKK
ncbi:MAG: Zn-ribbon domain-containing protein [Methanimicrococcus sp.]|nr:Zn-ribbon domain-containing protein [Methanimicrococcus sp.]